MHSRLFFRCLARSKLIFINPSVHLSVFATSPIRCPELGLFLNAMSLSGLRACQEVGACLEFVECLHALVACEGETASARQGRRHPSE
jgi:hypothetical protein